MNRILLGLSLMIVWSARAQTPGITFQSGPEQTALLELYTSEGCSSCPPAEAWLTRLTRSPRLWKEFVPLAFHVDYWDYLGWRDRWSAKTFSDRQRAHARRWGSGRIYTPGFVLIGQEWRNWSERMEGPPTGRKPSGVLTINSADTNRWAVSFAPATPATGKYEVHAALLAGGLTSSVTAGENQGRQLEHDFVVLTLAHASLTHEDGTIKGTFNLDAPRKGLPSSHAVGVWITHAGELEPLQATGGWLTRKNAATH